MDDTTTAALIRRFYEIGIHADWWKAQPMARHEAWNQTCQSIADHDPHVRGIVVLGPDAPEDLLAESFQVAAGYDLVKGICSGRTILARLHTTGSPARSTTMRPSTTWRGVQARLWHIG